MQPEPMSHINLASSLSYQEKESHYQVAQSHWIYMCLPFFKPHFLSYGIGDLFTNPYSSGCRLSLAHTAFWVGILFFLLWALSTLPGGTCFAMVALLTPGSIQLLANRQINSIPFSTSFSSHTYKFKSFLFFSRFSPQAHLYKSFERLGPVFKEGFS